jgi:hypothetical protein
MGGVEVMVGVRVARRPEVGLRLGVGLALEVGLGVLLGVSASGVVLSCGFTSSLGEGVGERGGKSAGGRRVAGVEGSTCPDCPSVTALVGRLSAVKVEAGMFAGMVQPANNMNNNKMERTRQKTFMRCAMRVSCYFPLRARVSQIVDSPILLSEVAYVGGRVNHRPGNSLDELLRLEHSPMAMHLFTQPP